MLNLICGPSSVGKSTFIQSNFLYDLTGLDNQTKLYFPAEIESTVLTEDASLDILIHYNLMRPIHYLIENDTVPSRILNESWNYDIDPKWQLIKACDVEKRAFLLVTSAEELKTRVLERAFVESALRSDLSSYDVDFWSAVYEVVNLRIVYRDFLDQLDQLNIPVTCIASQDGRFFEIDREEITAFLINDRPLQYSKVEIERMISHAIFEYQSVKLPYGLKTGGQDRGPSARIVLKDRLDGMSVLDIGSALGDLCFEAEARGALHVVGLEPRQTRFEAASVLKELKNSHVEYRNEYLHEFFPSAQFDIVLLLNVLHHMDNPFSALKKCAELCKGTLVIEVPNLADEIFGTVSDTKLGSYLNSLPLIGVSSLSVDQTFLFTPTAIKRMLLDHNNLFSAVEEIKSPMRNRNIYICNK